MAVLGNLKVFSTTITNGTNTYYSEREYEQRLGDAEKFFVELRASSVAAGAPNITVTLETSTDGVNWFTRGTFANLTNASVSNGTVISDSLAGTVGARLSRFTLKMGGTTPSAYIELWATDRNAI
jgi:hypothetical protein